ncbi:colicin immunity domain-containing protein, partial [Povalibacter sp.]|uniref:colicin immunity domain-containing protein n=1 Tax=Povalibacter sp. TaxID=1962978 RepID=UPI002F42F9C7
MSYLEHEPIYRDLVAGFLATETQVDAFVEQYFAQWRRDRDEQWNRIHSGQKISGEESELCRKLDAIFTACDSYSPTPTAA